MELAEPTTNADPTPNRAAPADAQAVAVSIIVPMLNEESVLTEFLVHLREAVLQPGVEVLLVDGGSTDASLDLARAAGFTPIFSRPGRAPQMNTGARLARGRLLLFLHADTRLPTVDLRDLEARLARTHRQWGRFDVQIQGRSRWLPMVAGSMNLRSRLTGIATGDQALFVTREAFEQVGGFPDQPLMEDIELSRRLKKHSRPLCLREQVLTSGRRWDQLGAWRTIRLMWRLRWAYWRGANPQELLEHYR